MFDAFAVTLRELAELMLIVGSMGACLLQMRRVNLVPYIAWGLVLGLVPAASVAAILMDSSFDAVVEAALSALMGLGVLLVAMSMVASAGTIRSRVRFFIEARLGRPSATAVVVGLVALAAFRESLEVAVFMRSISARSGAADALLGLMSGTVAAGLLILIWGGFLRILAASGSIEWAMAVEPFLKGGAPHAWLRNGLMLIPLMHMIRGWWLGARSEGTW